MSKRIFGLSGLVLGFTLLAGAGASARAAPLHGAHVKPALGSQIVQVHRRSHAHRHARHVDAPFTHVETGRHVAVDAPFTSVYVGRRGRYVRAPFVELWLPR